MNSKFSTVSSEEAAKHIQTHASSKPSRLSWTAIVYGLVAGALMSLFLSVSGFYLTEGNAAFGFLKFLILGAALFPLLVRTKKTTPPGKSVKFGIIYGMTASVTAAVVTALAVIFFSGKKALAGAVEGAADVAGNQFTLAGVTFFTCIVAGMIFTLIFMQLLKDDKAPA